MRLNLHSKPTRVHEQGVVLAIVMILAALGLALLASVMTWSSTSSRQTHRSIQYTRSVSSAEAATEKVIGHIEYDFLNDGARQVSNNLASYRQNTVPTTADSAYWNTWVFDDGNGNRGQTYVQQLPETNFVESSGQYAGLNVYATTYEVASHASDTANPQQVNAGVAEQIQLTGIPIFQFMMYGVSNMEISCGQPFNVTGRVHCNGTLYVEPDSSLTFESLVHSARNIIFGREPADSRGAPAGTVVYAMQGQPVADVSPLTLPIGTADTIQIIEPPPVGEDPNSALGKERYFNECAMMVVDTGSGITITADGVQVPSNQVPFLVSDSASFYDARESKTVQPIDLDIGNLTIWGATNNVIRNPSSIYVLDNRTLPATSLGAVRVKDGMNLPPNGLTVATDRPLYVQGDYNELNSTNLGTANTSATEPASLIADAITVLSDAWQDSSSTNDISQRNAAPTTVNAAFLTGVVETANGNYSGGMENFPRFLENWGSANIFTYNGSMIKMFPSQFATNIWGEGNVYNPPARNWAYDINFDDPTKLPPLTPSFLTINRSQWSTLAPGNNTPLSSQ